METQGRLKKEGGKIGSLTARSRSRLASAITFLLPLSLLLIGSGCGGPRDPEALHLGLTYIKGKEYEKAIESLKKVGEEHPNTVYEARALLAQAYAYRAGLQDLARAETSYRDYLAKFPQAPTPNKIEVLQSASSCAYWQNRFDQVEKDMALLIQWSGKASSAILFRQAMLQIHTKRWPEAEATLAEFRKSFPTDPLGPSALLLQVLALENMGELEKAKELLNLAQQKVAMGTLSWAVKKEWEWLNPSEDGTPSAGNKP